MAIENQRTRKDTHNRGLGDKQWDEYWNPFGVNKPCYNGCTVKFEELFLANYWHDSTNFVDHVKGLLSDGAKIYHDDIIKWKHFPHYWPFVRGIHRSPVNSPHKGQWRGALMFSLICALNERLSKQSWGWWFETPSRSLWRHCNAME